MFFALFFFSFLFFCSYFLVITFHNFPELLCRRLVLNCFFLLLGCFIFQYSIFLQNELVSDTVNIFKTIQTNLALQVLQYNYLKVFLILSCMILKIDEVYFKNLAMFILQDVLSTFGHFLILCMKGLKLTALKEKIYLNVYIHTSLWCLKRFYEGLKGLHKTF